ncbi:hypothetical protein AHMF7605_19940 [Adhaeribacter arboris]|uniref:DUF6249 domain-containing protein n=1 Tax=Adhaeribacter arboris TaxID=2072846 RepID=A0A2T2YJG1_9BACT|nr:hypothetical protein [Adhaeribacter arboris]PSR55615.1 hypothetical protein AHMF7605_19940 [Adhaeribacter arboris]
MQNFFGPVLIVIVAILFFGTIFGICYLYFTSRTRERLALVERGLDPNFFRPRRTALKYGMVIFSVVLGMTLGDLIPFRYPVGVPLGVMLGGLSLIVYYFIIDKRLDKRDEA